MSALAFDTHKAVTALQHAGFSAGQAEAVVNTMGAALGGNVATKADLTEAVTGLRAEMATLRADVEQLRLTAQADMTALKAELAALETRLTKHLYGVVLAGVGLTVTLTTVLLKAFP